MKRRLRPALALLATAVCLGVALLDWRSRNSTDVVGFFTPAGHLQAIASHRGGIVAILSEIPFGRDQAWDVDHLSGPVNDLDAVHDTVFTQLATLRPFKGLTLASGTIRVGGRSPAYRAARIPHWPVTLLAGLLAVMLWRPVVRRWRWRRQGRCGNCGYDLCGTPDRCPECGEVNAGLRAAGA